MKNPIQPQIYLGLVHHPTVNKRNETVTTSVTNLDVHDLARVSATFGMKGFIITPLEEQKKLLERVMGYWNTSKASDYNQDRVKALQTLSLKDSIEQCILSMPEKPILVATSAQINDQNPKLISIKNLQEKLKASPHQPMLLLFGTGWGLHPSVIDSVDYLLPPILGANNNEFNHLSVRAAFSIYSYLMVN